MAIRARQSGEFCWINILTPDPDSAREFFGAVLGWQYGVIPGMGHSIKVGGSDVGGLFDLNGPNTPPGAETCMGVMVRVESADATSDKAKALGGRGKPAFDVGPPGRMAECHDPMGANIDVWQSGNSAGTNVDVTLHGAPSWYELMTTDSARASEFYSALFGWTARSDNGAGFEYISFLQGNRQVAGLMAIPLEKMPMPTHWGVYFTVDDVDATVALARTLGATVFASPREIPGVGRFSGMKSPQGVRFYAMTYSM